MGIFLSRINDGFSKRYRWKYENLAENRDYHPITNMAIFSDKYHWHVYHS